MGGVLKDIDLLKDVEELAAIGVGHERLIALTRQRHHERAEQRHREANGLDDFEVVNIPMPPGASKRTIERYLAAIRKRWATEEEERRPERRQELRQKLQATFLKAYDEGGPSMGAAVRCLQVMAKMDGLEAATQIEVKGQIDVRAMSPFDRQKRIKELWALRRLALGSEDAEVIDVKEAPKKLPAKAKAKKKAPANKAKTKKPANKARKRTK